LLKELEGRLNSRHEMKESRKFAGLTEIQKAAAWLHNCMIGFGSDGSSFGIVKTGGASGAASRLTSLLAKIQNLHRAMDGVTIESLPWEHCLKTYDSPATLFFLDPPYTTGITKSYAPFKPAEMDALAAALPLLQGQFVLTVDDTPANRTRFAKYHIADKTSQSGTGNQNKGSGQFKELICASPLR